MFTAPIPFMSFMSSAKRSHLSFFWTTILVSRTIVPMLTHDVSRPTWHSLVEIRNGFHEVNVTFILFSGALQVQHIQRTYHSEPTSLYAQLPSQQLLSLDNVKKFQHWKIEATHRKIWHAIHRIGNTFSCSSQGDWTFSESVRPDM